jgi:hypothetical protein
MPSLADCFDLLINRFDPMDFIPAIIAKPAEIARIFGPVFLCFAAVGVVY